MRQKIILLLLGLCLIASFVFFYASNSHDWDLFLTTSEVDYRAWRIDQMLPLWSYQYCAGATRAGDPQAMSLSPLFLPVLLFGSFWGIKLLLCLCVGLGLWYTKQLLVLVTSPTTELPSDTHTTLYVVAACFVWGNFFLWHLHVGQVSFCLTYLAVGIVYYTLRAWYGLWRWRDWLFGVLLVWTYYTAGFYQASLFFMVPLFLALALALLGHLLFTLWRQQPVRIWLSRVGHMIGFHLLGLVFASYKLYFVLQYQKQFPRQLADKHQEILSFWQVLQGQLSPTWSLKYWGTWSAPSPYGIWESSFFHLGIWLLLIFLGYRLWTRRSLATTPETTPDTASCATHPTVRFPMHFLWWYGFVVLAFTLGDTFVWTPHAWLNTFVIKDAFRVTTRYQVGFVLLLTLLLALVLVRHADFRHWFQRTLASPVLLLLLLNMMSFQTTSSFALAGFYAKAHAKARYDRPLQTMVFTRPYDGNSYMYLPTLAGLGVINCSTPLRSDTRWLTHLLQKGVVVSQSQGKKTYRPRRFSYHFIDTQQQQLPPSCLRRSFFTQNRLFLHASCPPKLCLNIAHPNPYGQHDFRFDPKRGRWCRTKGK